MYSLIVFLGLNENGRTNYESKQQIFWRNIPVYLYSAPGQCIKWEAQDVFTFNVFWNIGYREFSLTGITRHKSGLGSCGSLE